MGLRRLLRRDTLEVNSTHHQATGRLGRGLRVSARAPDGVIEAVESSEGRSILAVQCHPERLVPERAEFLGVFAWLVRSARRSS